METTLLTAGVVCLIAAIVGGGLKAIGFELPALSIHRQILAAIIGVFFLGLSHSERIIDAMVVERDGSAVPKEVVPTDSTGNPASATAPVSDDPSPTSVEPVPRPGLAELWSILDLAGLGMPVFVLEEDGVQASIEQSDGLKFVEYQLHALGQVWDVKHYLDELEKYSTAKLLIESTATWHEQDASTKAGYASLVEFCSDERFLTVQKQLAETLGVPDRLRPLQNVPPRESITSTERISSWGTVGGASWEYAQGGVRTSFIRWTKKYDNLEDGTTRTVGLCKYFICLRPDENAVTCPDITAQYL